MEQIKNAFKQMDPKRGLFLGARLYLEGAQFTDADGGFSVDQEGGPTAGSGAELIA